MVSEGKRDSCELSSSNSSFQDDTEQVKIEWNEFQPCSDPGSLDNPGSHSNSEEVLSQQLKELRCANNRLVIVQETNELEKRQLLVRLQDYQNIIDTLQHEKCQLQTENAALEKQLQQCKEDRNNAEDILKETISSCQNAIRISQQYFQERTTEREKLEN